MKEDARQLVGAALHRAVQAWDWFWFHPANPTTLGVMRICTGILVLYVHLAYCCDLQQFFGRDAWMSWDRVQKLRTEAPWLAPSTGWEGMPASLEMPSEPAVRDSLLAFLKKFPEEPGQRRQYIEYLRDPKSPDVPVGVLNNYIINLPAGRLDLAEAGVPSNLLGPTRAQLIAFIYSLPESKAKRDDIIAYMEEWNYDPRQLAHKGWYNWSVWYHVTDPSWMAVTHAAILLIMLLFTIGFCSRITSVLTWLAAVSYIQRSSITLFGGDTMMNVLLLYMMIAPCGAVLSVDRLLARWWTVRRARHAGLPIPPEEPPAPSVSANFAQRLLQVHFCFIYLASGMSKLLGGSWWNGTAIYYTMANYEFSPLRYQYYLDTMRFLCQHRWLWEIVMTGGSFTTLALELSFPYLVWNRRLWPFLVAASMTLHMFIAVFMGLAAFSLLMVTLVMAFIPGEIMERILERLYPYLPAYLNRPGPVTRNAEPAAPVQAAMHAR